MLRNSLVGLRVLLTRPEGEGLDAWVRAFADVGAIPLAFPTIEVVPPDSWQLLDQVLQRISDYNWMIFTSQNTVAFVMDRMPGRKFPIGMRCKIAAVGPRTAMAIESHGGKVAILPADNRQEGLVDALKSLQSGTRIFLPLAFHGRTLLAEELHSQGCVVDVVTVYKTVPKKEIPPPPFFDIATFTCPAALKAFYKNFGVEVLAGKTVAVIGPSTAKEAIVNELCPIVAKSPNVNSLIVAIEETLAK
jgi:uroporphyrinogen-III synthase